jgi:hypothetical protein
MDTLSILAELSANTEETRKIMEPLGAVIGTVGFGDKNGGLTFNDYVNPNEKFVPVTPQQAAVLYASGIQVFALSPKTHWTTFCDVETIHAIAEHGTTDATPILAISMDIWRAAHPKELRIPVHDGTLVVGACTDPNNPGAYMGYETECKNYIDLFVAETKENEEDLTLYTFTDPYSEEYSDKHVMDYDDIRFATNEKWEEERDEGEIGDIEER